MKRKKAAGPLPQRTDLVKDTERKKAMEEEKMIPVEDEALEQASGGTGSGAMWAKVVHCDAVNLRDATKHGNIITVIPCGTKVPFFGRVGLWGKVSYKGHIGYIYQDYFAVLQGNAE